MASISDFGIACALPMAALGSLSLSDAAQAHIQAQAPATTDLTIEIVGLRDSRGTIRICLTPNPKSFPDCKGTDAVHATVKASMAPIHYQFRSLAPGTYAIAVFHDANGNGKLDTMMGIPREGFAFSRNPPMKPRAPHFNETSFRSNGPPLSPLKMKYLL